MEEVVLDGSSSSSSSLSLASFFGLICTAAEAGRISEACPIPEPDNVLPPNAEPGSLLPGKLLVYSDDPMADESVAVELVSDAFGSVVCKLGLQHNLKYELSRSRTITMAVGITPK